MIKTNNAPLDVIGGGECDKCGDTYDVGSRFDHDAISGLCWECSDLDLNDMSAEEFAAYVAG